MIDYIQKFSIETISLTFPDHYYFKPKDIELIANRFNEIPYPNKVIITTEKDAIRLRESQLVDVLKNLPIFYIPIEIDFYTMRKYCLTKN